MLLRLLPRPSSSNPTPATILFTLPITSNPYSGKGLPLPINLQAHRSLCAQEGIECNNALLGDKANWIAGVVDEVTFCMQSMQVTAHLTDGSSVALPVSDHCEAMLHAVIEQVQLSFAPAPRPTPIPVAGPSNPAKRSPSALLYTLLSPLLSQQIQAPQPQHVQNPSRLHRRLARSLLVDAYRRHVLTALKEVLPQTFLLWTIQTEMETKQQEWESARDEVDGILSNFGIQSNSMAALPRKSARSAGFFDGDDSASSAEYSSADSDSEADSSLPTTPGASSWDCTTPASLSPLSHLASLPPSAVIPTSHRSTYATLVARLGVLASRLSSLKKLRTHLEREEGRRRWLEGMEASKMAEKASRRAWSNKSQAIGCMGSIMTCRPLQNSSLRISTTANSEREIFTHPSMMDSEDESDSQSITSSLESSESLSCAPGLIASRSNESISSTDSDMDIDETHSISVLSIKGRTAERIWGVDDVEADAMDECRDNIDMDAGLAAKISSIVPVGRGARRKMVSA